MGIEDNYNQVRSVISLQPKYWFNQVIPDDKRSDSDKFAQPATELWVARTFVHPPRIAMHAENEWQTSKR
jgi:hypothetical protein